MRATERRRRTQGGTAMLESALTFSAFLLLTFGVMEFSMAVYAQNFCAYVSHDAARWAAVRGSTASTPAGTSEVRAWVLSQAAGLSSDRMTVTTTWAPDNKPGSVVAVNVSYSVLPLVGLAQKSQFSVGSTSAMTIVR